MVKKSRVDVYYSHLERAWKVRVYHDGEIHTTCFFESKEQADRWADNINQQVLEDMNAQKNKQTQNNN